MAGHNRRLYPGYHRRLYPRAMVLSPRMPDLASLETLKAVVGTGSLNAAATQLGVTQQAVRALRAVAAEDTLRGRPWDASTVADAAAVLAGAGTPMDDHRASARYRAAMLEQSLLKFYDEHPSREEVAS